MASKPTSVPFAGERYPAEMLKKHKFDSGTMLKKGDRVIVWTEHSEIVGIEWNDRDGNHVAGVPRDEIKRLPW